MQEIGTVISTLEGPSSNEFCFVVKDVKGIPIRKGQFVQLQTEEGLLIARVSEIIKTNRYFMRAESVSEYERSGRPLMEVFPVDRWEYLVAHATSLGIYSDGLQKRVSFPPSPGQKVFAVDEKVLFDFLGLDQEKGLAVGEVEFHNIDSRLNLTKLFQKHCAILSQTGFGKCLSHDSEIILGNGDIVKIGDLVNSLVKKYESKIENETEYVKLQDKLTVLGLDNNLKIKPFKIKAVSRRKSPEKIIEFELYSGKKIKVTQQHPFLTITKDGLKWKLARDFKINERIAVPRVLPITENYYEINLIEILKEKLNWYADLGDLTKEIKKELSRKFKTIKNFSKMFNIPYRNLLDWLNRDRLPIPILITIVNSTCRLDLKEKVKRLRLKQSRGYVPSKLKFDEKLAKFIGYVFSEAHTCRQRISLNNLEKNIIEDFKRLGESIFGLKCHTDFDRKIPLAYFNSTSLATIFTQLFELTNSARTKLINNFLLKSPKSVIYSFLSALIDCDGYVSRDAPVLEIGFSNEKANRQVSRLFLRFGIISYTKPKVRKTKSGPHTYYYLYVEGSDNFRKLNDILELKTEEKKQRIKLFTSKISNPNLDIVPNVSRLIGKIAKSLNISLSKLAKVSKMSQIDSYVREERNPSRQTLYKIVHGLEKRTRELQEIEKLINLTRLPYLDRESLAFKLNRVREENGVMFKTISQKTNISATTVRRTLLNITGPTDSIFEIAKSMSDILSGDFMFQTIQNKEKIINSLETIRNILGLSCPTIDKSCIFYKGRTSAYLKSKNRTPSYENLWKIHSILEKEFDKLKETITEAKNDINFLKILATSDVFWEPIIKINEKSSSDDYVYDLSIDGGNNFIANDVIVHNSHLVSILIEEILERKEKLGKPAIIVADPHGEYVGFVKDGKFITKTKVFDKSNISIATYELSANQICEFQPFISSVERRELSKIIEKMKERKSAYDLNDLIAEIEISEIKPVTKAPLISWLSDLNSTGLFKNIDSPTVEELAVTGQLSVLDLSEFIHLRDRQIIVANIARKLFAARRENKVPPFIFVLEEAHQFAPEKEEKSGAISKNVIETIAREGRKFNACLVLVSQRPIQLSTTALSQCNSHIILRVSNPYDLDHIGKSCEGVTRDVLNMIPGLKVGEALITGEVVNYPLLVKVRDRKSKKSEKGAKLEDALIKFNPSKINSEDLKSFM